MRRPLGADAGNKKNGSAPLSGLRGWVSHRSEEARASTGIAPGSQTGGHHAASPAPAMARWSASGCAALKARTRCCHVERRFAYDHRDAQRLPLSAGRSPGARSL